LSEQARAYYENGRFELERIVITPTTERLTELEKSAELETTREIAEARKAAMSLHVQIQDACEAQVTEFRNVIFPEMCRSLAAFYVYTKATVSEDAQKLHAGVISTATEIREVGIPRILAAIQSYIAYATANLLAEGSKLQESFSTFGHRVQETLNAQSAHFQNEVIPGAKHDVATLSSIAKDELIELQKTASVSYSTAKDATEATMSQIRVSVATNAGQANSAVSKMVARMETDILPHVSTSAAAAQTNLQESFSSKSSAFRESVSNTAHIPPHQDFADSSETSTGTLVESLSSQYERLQNKLTSR